MLEMATSDGVVAPRERELLAEFAARHAIGRDERAAALARLGWTEPEFDAGRQVRWRGRGREESATTAPAPAPAPAAALVQPLPAPAPASAAVPTARAAVGADPRP